MENLAKAAEAEAAARLLGGGGDTVAATGGTPGRVRTLNLAGGCGGPGVAGAATGVGAGSSKDFSPGQIVLSKGVKGKDTKASINTV